MGKSVPGRRVKSMRNRVDQAGRLALFYGFFGGGGVERCLINLAQGFLDRGLRVDVVLGQAGGPHLAKLPAAVRLIDLNASRQLARLPKLARYLRHERPSALLAAGHFTNEIAVCARALAQCRTRVIVAEHNTLSRAARPEAAHKQRLRLLSSRLCYPWADGIVAVSRGVACDLASIIGCALERIRVIYNPVVTQELLAKAHADLHHAWFRPGAPPVILGIGKLEAQKDFPTLIRAFAQVRAQRTARLMILGWGPDRPQLEALIKDLRLAPDVELAGHVANPYAYMSRAAILALSSAWEGLPTVLIEALAVGLPVVSTNCPSGPAEILGNGHRDLLTPVHDHGALAAAILRVLSGCTRPVAPQRLDAFRADTVVEQYLEVMGVA
jgi:glycosyltransferase involved in cell wall biosynthesis